MRIGGENGFREAAVAKVEVTPRAGATGDEGPSPFARVLRGLGREVDHGEKVMRRAIDSGGKDLSSSELLALQAGVYRYSEAVDLSAKLIDRATSGIKTVLQGQ
jgi:hypothetical protein